MEKSAIFNKIEQIQNLPTLSVVIQKLNTALEDPNMSTEQISAIIQDDPAMMARILRVVNSAFFGISRPVASISQAVALLGFIAVKNIATTTSAFSTFDIKEQTDFDREEFWRHSICVGIATNVLYDYVKGNLQHRMSSDLLHLAGLVHGIGIIIFEQYFHIKFMVSLLLSQKENLPLIQTEIEALGANHCEVGAWLGKRWNLPPEVVECIRWHHDPEQSDPKYKDLVNLVHTANYICTLERLGDYGDSSPTFKQSVWREMGLSVKDIPEIVDKIKEESVKSEILLAIAK